MGFHATEPLLVEDTPSKNRVMGSRRFSFDDAPKTAAQVADSHLETTLTVTIYVSGLQLGEQFDADLGMYFLRARYLETDRGRFWSMDTYEGWRFDPASLHKYLYAHSNPVTFVDPSGQFTLAEVISVARIIATLSNIVVVSLYIYVKTADTGPVLECWGRCMDARVNGVLYGVVAFLELTASVGKPSLGWEVGAGESFLTSYIRHLSVNGLFRPYSTMLANWIKRGELFGTKPIGIINTAYFALSGYIAYNAVSCGWKCNRDPNCY